MGKTCAEKEIFKYSFENQKVNCCLSAGKLIKEMEAFPSAPRFYAITMELEWSGGDSGIYVIGFSSVKYNVIRIEGPAELP